MKTVKVTKGRRICGVPIFIVEGWTPPVGVVRGLLRVLHTEYESGKSRPMYMDAATYQELCWEYDHG
jgi:hypothetical protein